MQWVDVSLCVGVGLCVSNVYVVLYFKEFWLLMDMIGRSCFMQPIAVRRAAFRVTYCLFRFVLLKSGCQAACA